MQKQAETDQNSATPFSMPASSYRVFVIGQRKCKLIALQKKTQSQLSNKTLVSASSSPSKPYDARSQEFKTLKRKGKVIVGREDVAVELSQV